MAGLLKAAVLVSLSFITGFLSSFLFMPTGMVTEKETTTVSSTTTSVVTTTSLEETTVETTVCVKGKFPAISPEGECRTYYDSCDVPENWFILEKCPEVGTQVPETTTTTTVEETTTTYSPISHLLITQVFYDTPGTDSDEEWLEIYNPTANTVILTGYKIKDNTGSWDVPEGTSVAGKSYLIIARNESGFNSLYGCSPGISGLTLSLSNSGDQLILNNGASDIDLVAWEGYLGGWDIAAGTNESIKRIFETDSDSPNDWLNNQIPDPANC